MVRVQVSSLAMDQATQNPVVLLEAPEEKEAGVLPIWIGHPEATAIASQLYGHSFERPLTHDLLRIVIEGLEARVDRVVITDLKENTFFALIHVTRNGQQLAIDARPSDAMALALRSEVPILVEETVLEKSSVSGEESGSDETERLRKWLENVDPEELGQYEM